MPAIKRLSTAALALCATALLALQGAPAQAKHSQLAMFEDDAHLLADPGATMRTLHQLGVGIVRVYVEWSAIAPRPLSFTKPRFDAANPNSYPSGAWSRYDGVVAAAQRYRMKVDFLVTGGAPLWATGPKIPALGKNRHFAWRPSASAYRDFVHAVGLRYQRSVRYWEIWNEPNFGEDLAPQAINGSRVSVAPGMYRDLVDAAWGALGVTGHGRDTIVVGQLAARGMQGPVTRRHPQGLPGNFAQTKPLQFIRTLYCLDGAYRPLRGRAAAAVRCPTKPAASRRFAAQHPGLFRAGGFGIHPYPQNLPPTRDASADPDFVSFSRIPTLERTLDRAQRAYRAAGRMPIYNNEYGYVTHPPARAGFASPTTAALYMNWAEYLSWKDPRLATTMQYLLYDPPERGPSQFFSGLQSSRGRPKVTLAAYRMPLFLAAAAARRVRSIEVWGAVRPAPASGVQRAQIQFRRGSRGPFKTIKTVTITDSRGYFDVRIRFPSSGAVRVAWKYPGGATITSRVQGVSVR